LEINNIRLITGREMQISRNDRASMDFHDDAIPDEAAGIQELRSTVPTWIINH